MTIAPIPDHFAEWRKEMADALREYAQQVEDGSVTDFVLVGREKAEGYFQFAAFEDRWRLLAACEYAKQAIHEA